MTLWRNGKGDMTKDEYIAWLELTVVDMGRHITHLQHVAIAMGGNYCTLDCCASSDAAKAERAALNASRS